MIIRFACPERKTPGESTPRALHGVTWEWDVQARNALASRMCPVSIVQSSLCAASVRTSPKMLAAKGIQTAEDLLYHLPFRYEDRQNPRSLDELKPGETASVIAEVRGAALLRTRRMPLFELTVGQGRHALKCIWFHATYLDGKFHAGQTVALYGKIEPSRSSSNFKMIQPQFEILPDASDDAETRLLEVGRITPVYESLGGARLASRWQRKVIFNLLESMRGTVPECLPASMLARLDMPDRETALREVHFPPGRHVAYAVAILGHAAASPPDLRGVVLP